MIRTEFVFDLQRFEDIFYNQTYGTLLSGTDDDDSIVNWSDSVTIDAGMGNDEIILGYFDFDHVNNVIIYNNGDGNDSIEGFNSTSKLSISVALIPRRQAAMMF